MILLQRIGERERQIDTASMRDTVRGTRFSFESLQWQPSFPDATYLKFSPNSAEHQSGQSRVSGIKAFGL